MLKDNIIPGIDFVKLKMFSEEVNIYKTGFIGRHQLNNAALALLLLNNTLGIENFDVLNSGLLNVKRNSGLEGRFEIYNEKPLIIFDSAHNAEGASAFVEAFADKGKRCRKRKLIFGAMRDKKIESILKIFKEYFDEFYFTSIDFHRAAAIEELLEAARRIGIEGKPLRNPVRLINEFSASGSEDCLAVVGSIYVLGEIKSELRKTSV